MAFANKKKEPVRIRTCREVLDELSPRLRGQPFELDYSFKHDAITITDMRVPSALRMGVLFTRHEIEAGADLAPGEFAKRVNEFSANGLRG